MKKIFAIALVLAAALFLITACGDGGDSGEGLGNIIAYNDSGQGGSGDKNPPGSDDASDENGAYVEAYLDILTRNRALLTTQEEWMFLSDGKIAIASVFGNEEPELLYIYVAEDNPYNERLKIFTYSETEGAVSVFDAVIYSMAGGGGNYCVYLTQGGDLIVYYSIYGEFSYYGFWQIEPMSPRDLANLDDPYYVYFSFERKTDAMLFYWTYPDDDNDYEMSTTYMQGGNEIPKDEFNARAKEIMGDIGRVLFQSTGMDDYGLYDRDTLWKSKTPLEAEFMTYKEAVSWLEARQEGQ